MRAPILIAIVILIHAFAIGAVVFVQGCGTRQPTVVEPPTAPVMPPTQEAMVPTTSRPVFTAPSPVEPAPSMAVPTEGKTYVVKRGDVLSKIATRFGITARELAEINNIKDPNKIRVGQKLLLPDYAGGAAPRPAARETEPVAVGEGSVYVVQAGDNLSKIASRHGVKLAELRAANNLQGDKILVGQKLVIPSGGAAPAPTAPAPVPVAPAPAPMPSPAVPEPAMETPAAPGLDADEPTLMEQDEPLDYIVQEGDTLDSIAKLFIVRKEDIVRINNIADPEGLRPGQKLKIPPSEL